MGSGVWAEMPDPSTCLGGRCPQREGRHSAPAPTPPRRRRPKRVPKDQRLAHRQVGWGLMRSLGYGAPPPTHLLTPFRSGSRSASCTVPPPTHPSTRNHGGVAQGAGGLPGEEEAADVEVASVGREQEGRRAVRVPHVRLRGREGEGRSVRRDLNGRTVGAHEDLKTKGLGWKGWENGATRWSLVGERGNP